MKTFKSHVYHSSLIDTTPAVIKAPFVKASDGLKEYHSLFFSLADEAIF
jgi:hypothetical protein